MIFDIKDRELEGIKVVGHTDTSCPPGDSQAGCEAYNQTLSERRAETVGQSLVQQGIPVGLITTEGVGMNDLAVQTAAQDREPGQPPRPDPVRVAAPRCLDDRCRPRARRMAARGLSLSTETASAANAGMHASSQRRALLRHCPRSGGAR